MKHLCIYHLGPLKEADIDFGRFNLIIGKQSSGKSCVLRTASFCAWVEKRISLSQSADFFMQRGRFRDELVRYHKMDGYFESDTIISYETDCLKFIYDNKVEQFQFAWKKRLEYRRPKISYVPSERNIVSLLPNWKSQVSTYDCVLDFMNDWDHARRYLQHTKDILNLGMSYHYRQVSDEDKMVLHNKKELLLSNSSSGVQSLIPLYVNLDYLANGVYSEEAVVIPKRTQEQREQIQRLLKELYFQIDRHSEVSEKRDIVFNYTNVDFHFDNILAEEEFKQVVNRFVFTQRSDVYLEEPEDNLFPPTQCQLMDWLIEFVCRRKHTMTLFVTTHSPYILTHLLQSKIPGFRFFFTYQSADGDGFIVRTATKNEMAEIYDNGVDMFFNFEAYIHHE